jgi:hypothetical protein
MKKYNLGFSGCEKSARAGMDTVTEDIVIGCRRNKLMLVFVARLLAFLEESVTIISGSTGVDAVIFQRLCRNGDIGAFGNNGSIGENDFAEGEAADGGCLGMSARNSFGNSMEISQGRWITY